MKTKKKARLFIEKLGEKVLSGILASVDLKIVQRFFRIVMLDARAKNNASS